jgi:hypothetical protein
MRYVYLLICILPATLAAQDGAARLGSMRQTDPGIVTSPSAVEPGSQPYG